MKKTILDCPYTTCADRIKARDILWRRAVDPHYMADFDEHVTVKPLPFDYGEKKC